MTNEDSKEKLTAAYYREKHKNMRNCWDWDDSGLDDEHPGSRDRFFRDVECFVRSLEAHGYVIMPVEATEEMVMVGAAVLDMPSAYMSGPSRANQRRSNQRRFKDAYYAIIDAGKVTL